jgi:hypothetical protein
MAFLNKILTLFFILFVMLCFYTTKVWATDNYLNDFENDNDWTITNNSVLFSLTSQEFHSATQSAIINNTSSTSYGIEHIESNIQPNLNYNFKAFIKILNPAPSKVLLRIAWYSSADGSGAQIKTTDSEIITTETSWKEINTTAIAPTDAHSAKLRLLVANGMAYFDDISFQQIQLSLPTIFIVTTPTNTPEIITGISISEAMVNPQSGDSEWVELYNQNNFDVTLQNWFIDDIENGGASPKQFSLIIPANGYASADISSSLFNNSNDDVRLLNAEKVTIDSFSYEDSKPNITIGKYDNMFCFQKPSKNAINNECEQNNVDTITPTKVPSPVPSISASVLGVSTIKKVLNSPVPSPLPTLKKYLLPQSQLKQSNTTGEIPIITFSEKKQGLLGDSAKPWLMISGSYSILAFISISIKTFILKHP